MNIPIDTFDSVLEKYDLKRAVPPAVQDDILDFRKADYRKLLKKIGKYSTAYWLAVLAYTSLKKIGINLSLLQSKVIVGITAIALSTGSVTGIYQGVSYVRKIIQRQELKKTTPLRNDAVPRPEDLRRTAESTPGTRSDPNNSPTDESEKLLKKNADKPDTKKDKLGDVPFF